MILNREKGIKFDNLNLAPLAKAEKVVVSNSFNLQCPLTHLGCQSNENIEKVIIFITL